MGKGKNWTREEEELLQELWGHRSIEAIARRLGRSVNAIKIRVSRMGLPPWVAEQRRKDAVGHRHREQKYWTRAEDERLRHLASLQRYNYAELAEMLGRSENAVRCRCKAAWDQNEA